VHKVNLKTRRFTAAVITGSFGIGLLLTAGCHRDELPPASTGYYNGPMKPKGAPKVNPGGAPGRNPSAADP
jgi:hypothetical protein